MKPANPPAVTPGRYRVTMQCTDWFEVDVYASRTDEALEIAEDLDHRLVERRVHREWKVDSAEAISDCDFFPVNEPTAISTLE